MHITVFNAGITSCNICNH